MARYNKALYQREYYKKQKAAKQAEAQTASVMITSPTSVPTTEMSRLEAAIAAQTEAIKLLTQKLFPQ